jgi:hypothetical protein
MITPLAIEDTASPVRADGGFTILVGSEQCHATICWDKERNKYVVDSPALRALRLVETTDDRRELVSAIDEEQAVRVVPLAGEVLYSHGHFFRPVLPVQRRGAFQLLDILQLVVELGEAVSEKGQAIVDDDWPEYSVFGLIGALNPATARRPPEAMPDLGTQISDFLAIQGNLVVLIHAKAPTQTKLYSASALHDVASQAIKNLPYLRPITETRPPLKHWMRPWRASRTAGETHRLRVGSFQSGTDIWTRARTVIANPNSQREVWLAIGRGLSKRPLTREVRRRPPSAEAMQMFSPLKATWGAVSQLLPARLRIFCSP